MDLAKSTSVAQKVINLVEQGRAISTIKAEVAFTEDEWHRYSSKAYALSLARGRRDRKEMERKKHVATTPNKEVLAIIELNDFLADYALLLPIFATSSDFQLIQRLAKRLPHAESEVINALGKMTMHPKLRVMQKRGRIEKFQNFKVFSKLIDAAMLAYYRTNFISCYLTLLPVVEGIIIRWMGYTGAGAKPEFEAIRKFFKNSAQRQPCPSNILFHHLYIKACDKILNSHFYKPSKKGIAYANFNRHVASHLLNDDQFATKANCIRLFILIDAMTEIYLYESRISDPRFVLRNEDIHDDIKVFAQLLVENTRQTGEHIVLGTSASDVLI